MASKTGATFRKSVDNLYNVWYNFRTISQGREIKNAIYNIGAVAAVATIAAVYLVLYPFFKPLLWAFLIGAVLFPFKRGLTTLTRSWFEQIEKDDTHLVIGIARAPFDALEFVGGYFGKKLIDNIKPIIIAIACLAGLRILLRYAPRGIICFIWRTIVSTNDLFITGISLLNIYLVVSLVIGYGLVVLMIWQPNENRKFVVLGQAVWFIVIAYACSYLGSFQTSALLALLAYGLFGIIYETKMRNAVASNDNRSTTTVIDHFKSVLDVQTISHTEGTTSLNKTSLNVPTSSEKTLETQADSHQSDLYFKGLFYACAATLIYCNMWLLLFVPIPIICHFMCKLYYSSGLRTIVHDKYAYYTTNIQKWIIDRRFVLLPVCLPGIMTLNRRIHDEIRNFLKETIDMVVSILVIILLILILIFTSIFLSVQIYSEGMVVAKLGHDLVNRTLVSQPDLMAFFPSDMMNSIDDVVDNVYLYGRNGIETYVDGLLKDTDQKQAVKMKAQILTVWDRLVQSWLDREKEGVSGPRVSTDALKDSLEDIVNNPITKEGLISWAKNNFHVLKGAMGSVWLIIKNNIYLLVSMFGTIFSSVLVGGYAVTSFLVDTIIFFTALFYLLSNSHEKYAPLTISNSLAWSSGPRIAESLEGSISGVLIATAKLSLFHGMFTWLTHTVFGASVIYLPSVLAASLGAAPFLGTYWCSIPAFLDLWLAQDRFYTSVTLLLLHLIIPSTVDAIIYAEIKGGAHPYITGLSIAGGMYWLGLHGAILGPLMLCFLMMIFDVTLAAMRENSPTTPDVRYVNAKDICV